MLFEQLFDAKYLELDSAEAWSLTLKIEVLYIL